MEEERADRLALVRGVPDDCAGGAIEGADGFEGNAEIGVTTLLVRSHGIATAIAFWLSENGDRPSRNPSEVMGVTPPNLLWPLLTTQGILEPLNGLAKAWGSRLYGHGLSYG